MLMIDNINTFLLYFIFMLNADFILDRRFKKDKKHYFLFFVFYIIGILLIYLVERFNMYIMVLLPYLNKFFQVFIIYTITNFILYKNRFRETIFISLETYIIYTLVENLIYYLGYSCLDFINKFYAINIINNMISNKIIFIIFSISIYILVQYFFTKKWIDNSDLFMLLDKRNYCALLFILLIFFYFFISVTLHVFKVMFSSIDIVSITIIYIVVFLTLSFCVLYFLKINLELEEKEKELKKYIELKEQSYEEIVSSAQEMRKLSHDIKNHNNILGMLLRDQKVEEAINYLDTIGDEVEIRNKLKFCKNLILNSVIRSKIGEFAKNDINFTYDLKIYKEIKMTDFDIVTLFMNLLDNSIEACKKVETDRFINLKIKTIENKMMVEISNSSDIREDCVYQNIMTSKDDKVHHGFGTKNIKDVVHKYSGNVRFTNDNYKFKVVLYINI